MEKKEFMNNSVYMVRFVEPPYCGSATDIFLFSSLQAIYGTFTKEQIGCGVNRLWNIGEIEGYDIEKEERVINVYVTNIG